MITQNHMKTRKESTGYDKEAIKTKKAGPHTQKQTERRDDVKREI